MIVATFVATSLKSSVSITHSSPPTGSPEVYLIPGWLLLLLASLQSNYYCKYCVNVANKNDSQHTKK